LPEPGSVRDPAADPQPPIVAVANGLFAQDGVEVKRPFLDVLAGQYGAGVQVVDFQAGTAKAAIDAWVRKQTAERIQKLFDQIPPETRVVLANAVYLKADWQTPFLKEPLEESPFTRADGSVVTATMMRRVDEGMRYAEGDGWQAVEIPYAGEELAMWVIVPEVGGSPAALLAPEILAQVGSGMKGGVVELELPKWDFATELDLKPPMTGLGMELPFDPAADFSGMTDLDLFIGQAIHRANITVDEWGTEAAAVTGIGFEESGPPEPDIVVHADHPFAFVIRHTATGTPLFIGQVADPTAD
jgi:serpin B